MILVGLPGSGKTTVGRVAARRLGLAFCDTDRIIEARLGCPIGTFFELSGEAAFRDIEEAVLDELTESCKGTAVVATGGGAVLRAANRERMRSRDLVVYLRARPEYLIRRLRNDSTRPLLQVSDPLKRLREIYQEREPLYQEVAHVIVETGRDPLSVLVNKVLMQTELATATYRASPAPS